MSNQTCPRCGKQNPADIHTCTPLALKLADELMAGDVLQAAAPTPPTPTPTPTQGETK